MHVCVRVCVCVCVCKEGEKGEFTQAVKATSHIN